MIVAIICHEKNMHSKRNYIFYLLFIVPKNYFFLNVTRNFNEPVSDNGEREKSVVVVK